ncbi:MAG: tRNA dihydrouridine synthase DusB [Clostridia bacterium]|nr:tRNA dihydrouridine synthase DusB [Clostridia bacterium]
MTEFYSNKIFLAPMAGVTDLAFRTLCKEHGADLVVSEMVSSRGLHYKDKKTNELLKSNDIEAPLIVQLFGNEPEIMAEAAKILEDMGVKYLDINMGCPAPKIVKNGDGCSLMRNETLAGKISESVVKAVKIPVSVKFRAGWDSDSINAVSFAKTMENAGVSCVTVHGRTKDQFYSGNADYDIIKQVRDAVKIPVIANGDVIDGKTAIEILEKTGCNSLMVGRGSLGNPFVFGQIKAAFEGNVIVNVSSEQKRKALLRHIELMEEYKPEHIGVPEMRKHFAWYLKGIPHSGKYKLEAFAAKTYIEMKKIAIKIF